MSLKNFHRYSSEGWVAGVCVGIATHFDWNVKLLRVLLVVGLFFSGFFPLGLIYCLLWYMMEDASVASRPRNDDSAPRSTYTPSAYATPASASDVKSRFARMEERLRGMEECVSSKDFELRREFKKLES